MSVLTLDVGGPNEMSVDCQRAGHAAPRQVGQKQFPGSGSELPYQIRGEFMVVPVVLTRLPTAAVETIRTLFALGRQVNCAGDVFVNGGATAKWSGKITDELHETADTWTISMTLFECGAVGGAVPSSVAIYLTNVASPDMAGANLASADPADDPFLAGLGGVRILDSATPSTCSGPAPCTATYTDPMTPEIVWWTPATTRAGFISGRARVGFLSKGASGGGAWADQAAMSKIFVVRGGVDVLEIDTDYTPNNGGFSGSFVEATAPTSVIFLSQIGDRFRVEEYGRIQLAPGGTDDQPAVLARQTITFGNGGAGLHYGKLTITGLAALFLP